MCIKSEKTFEEIVERIVALFRPQHSSDAREYDNSDKDRDSNGSRNPTGNANSNTSGDGNGDRDGGSDAPTPTAAPQDNPTVRRRRPSAPAGETTS
jgi:hypothetical protein